MREVGTGSVKKQEVEQTWILRTRLRFKLKELPSSGG